jgi:hypothetical protein
LINAVSGLRINSYRLMIAGDRSNVFDGQGIAVEDTRLIWADMSRNWVFIESDRHG